MFEIEKVFNVNSEIGPKSMYTKGTILIDDGLHNIYDHIENTGCPAIIYNHNNTYGWNKNHKPNKLIHTASNYDEVLKIIEQQLKKHLGFIPICSANIRLSNNNLFYHSE